MEKPKRSFGKWLGSLAHTDIELKDAKKNGKTEKHLVLEVHEPTAAEKRATKRKFIKYSSITVVLLLAVAAVWVAGNVYFTKIRLGDQVIAGHQTDVQLQAAVKAKTDAYQLAIAYPDGSTKRYSLQQVGVSVDPAATVNNIRRDQHLLINRLVWWHPVRAELKASVGSRLNSFITDHATVSIQPAKDASLTLNGSKVELSNSTLGKRYGLIGPITTLTTAAVNLQTEPLHLRTLATRPAISSQQLAASQTKLQKILAQKVTFIIDDKTVQAEPDDIAGWIEITPSTKDKSVDITVDSGKVLDYINKIAAASVHPPRDQVMVTHDDGSTAILVNGVNGTDVINKSDAAGQVASALLGNKGVEEKLSIQYAPFKTITSEAYPKWIEVDTTNKRMYAYEQGTLVRTFLVSAGAPLTPTVTGQFAIYAKYSQQDMYGENVDGSSYFQPHVPWVNYFYGSYAIHGNYWRPLSYFGFINSSHGCVGIVDSDAEWIYTWAPIGTPVIVHT